MSHAALGAILAGGRSTRYGAPKALAQVGGERVVDRVVRALRAVMDAGQIVAIANDQSLADAMGLPSRADALSDAGALAGLHAALLWARERELAGALVVACDMPFIESGLLREILSAADSARDHADAVLPESTGPRGMEPLCAWYSTDCIGAIEAAVERGDARMIGFHGEIRLRRLPLERVRQYGEPTILFRNLNTPTDRDAAERIAAERIAAQTVRR